MIKDTIRFKKGVLHIPEVVAVPNKQVGQAPEVMSRGKFVSKLLELRRHCGSDTEGVMIIQTAAKLLGWEM